jgi:predicted small secreted protein
MKKAYVLIAVLVLSFGTSACFKSVAGAGDPVSRSDAGGSGAAPCVHSSGSGACSSSGAAPSS